MKAHAILRHAYRRGWIQGTDGLEQDANTNVSPEVKAAFRRGFNDGAALREKMWEQSIEMFQPARVADGEKTE